MWVPPGKKSNANLWRFDMADKSFLPPGVPGKPKGIQVEMPEDYRGNEPRGFHMVASPVGTQAPIEHINYTPETGEVAGRGVPAPPDMLNYTLMPDEAMMGVGHGSATGAIAQGMGMGADVPAGAPPFPGTPPLFNSSSMLTGPDPGSQRAAPTWGGGGMSFDKRMGMGQEEDLVTGADPTRGGGATAGDATPGATPTTSSTNLRTPPLNINGQPAKPGDTIQIVYGTDGNPLVYMIFESMGQFGTQPTYRYDKAPAAAAGKETKVTTNLRQDGTVDVITVTPDGQVNVENRGKPDPALAAKIEADRKLAELNLAIKQLELERDQATSGTARREAEIKLQTAQVALQTAQANADKAAVEAANAGKPTPAAKPAEIVDRTGQVHTLNNDTGVYEPTGIYKAQGNWEKYNNTKTGMVVLFNPETREEIDLHPIDIHKEYPPEKVAGGKWIQWDPQTETYKTVYQESPDYNTMWSGDELIAVNKNDPTDIRPVWKKKPSLAEDDAHTAAIDAHNKAMLDLEKTKADIVNGRITAAQARVTMEKDLQELLHPKPIFSGEGSFYLPPGADVNIQDFNPWTKATSNRSMSGGPLDPRTGKMISEIDKFLGDISKPVEGQPDPTKLIREPDERKLAGAQPDPTKLIKEPNEVKGALPPKPEVTVGEQMGGEKYKPGWPGSDPRLSGGTQPPTQRTTESGDIAHYDAQGNLTGIDYLKTAPPGYEEGQGEQDITEEYFDEETGRRNPLYGAGHTGMGSMGAGLAEGGAGWVPRPGGISPAQGPGFLGGAGQDEDEDPNPILEMINRILGGAAGTTTMPRLPTGGHMPGPQIKVPGESITTKPKLPTGGHTPGPEIKPPSETDQGAKWKPDLKGVVTQRVNEPLKELLGWPKLEHTEPEEDVGFTGVHGGFDQPEIDPVDIQTGERFLPEPSSDVAPEFPSIKDFSHIIGEGGTTPEVWEEMEEEEGVGRGAGKSADPEAERILKELRERYGTLGVGQEPGGMMPPSGGTLPQIPPQGPGGEQPPEWLLTLLRNHPELLQMAGLSAAGPEPPVGGAPSPTVPPSGAAGAPAPPPLGPPAGGEVPPTPPPTAGWTPPPTGGPPTPPGGAQPPGGGAQPVAPSPEGAPMSPPLPPEDVAGIGHRFGQEMNVGEPQHSGVDLQAPEGTPTKSPVDGFVARVEDNPQGLGVTVIIKGMDGSEHRLGHLRDTKAFPGMQVARGQDLGSPVGETGMTTGAHLHWGVKDGQGQPADPTAALGPMAQMPPVPGTEMMGPPGGVGGGAQMGGGQEEPLPPGGAPPPPSVGQNMAQFFQPQQKQGAGQAVNEEDDDASVESNVGEPDPTRMGWSKGKRKKAGWKPRYGSGQAPPPTQPQGQGSGMNEILQQLLMQEWQRMRGQEQGQGQQLQGQQPQSEPRPQSVAPPQRGGF